MSRARDARPLGRLLVGCWLLGACAPAPAPRPEPLDEAPAPRPEPSGTAPAPWPASAPQARAWPRADSLFRQDARWLGGDAAVSIDLGGERVLWLFGDSFVTPHAAQPVDSTAAPEDAAERTQPPDPSGRAQPSAGRHGAVMVRNSIAIQRGLDPERAEMRFMTRAGPASFFPEGFPDGGEHWLWPQHGIVLDGELTIFLYSLVHAPGDALGFRYHGWSALRVRDPARDPLDWELRPLALPALPGLAMVGASVLADGQHVYAYALREPGDHAIFVVRWQRQAFIEGDLSDPRVWAGAARGWTRGPPEPVLAPGQTEFSVVADPASGYLLTRTIGFGSSTLVVQHAPAPQGPFAEPIEVYRPPEFGKEGVLIYGVRAHPEQAGGGLALTYNVNTLDAATLYTDLSIYFPRFVRLQH